jgi:hypothetical protein
MCISNNENKEYIISKPSPLRSNFREQQIYHENSPPKHVGVSHFSDFYTSTDQNEELKVIRTLKHMGKFKDNGGIMLDRHDNRVEAYGILTNNQILNNSYISNDSDYNVIQGPSTGGIPLDTIKESASLYHTPLSTVYNTPLNQSVESLSSYKTTSSKDMSGNSSYHSIPACSSTPNVDGPSTFDKLKHLVDKIIDIYDE